MSLALPQRTYFARFVTKLIVVIMINKAVVGCSCGDVPKYVGEGVALHRTPSTPDVPLLWCSCLSMAILGNSGVGMLWMWHVQSASSYLLMLHH